MFRDKYVYTCPDVIHDHEKARKNGRKIVAINLLLMAGFWIAGTIASRKMDEEFEKLMDEVPDSQEN
jgi:hypothetical protein